MVCGRRKKSGTFGHLPSMHVHFKAQAQAAHASASLNSCCCLMPFDSFETVES